MGDILLYEVPEEDEEGGGGGNGVGEVVVGEVKKKPSLIAVLAGMGRVEGWV